ncbi:hypothetical protein D3C73_1411690 [compost metagenome]
MDYGFSVGDSGHSFIFNAAGNFKGYFFKKSGYAFFYGRYEPFSVLYRDPAKRGSAVDTDHQSVFVRDLFVSSVVFGRYGAHHA